MRHYRDNIHMNLIGSSLGHRRIVNSFAIHYKFTHIIFSRRLIDALGERNTPGASVELAAVTSTFL